MPDKLTPTKFIDRFGDAIQLLCSGNRPDDEMITAWIEDESGGESRLQEFCVEHGPHWAQGIVVIDAAYILADQPTEIKTHWSDEDHEPMPRKINNQPRASFEAGK